MMTITEVSRHPSEINEAWY